MYNIFKLAARNLKRYKRRTFLTCMLITLGVVAVLLFVSISGSFKAMIERVLFATTADDARYSLNGAFLIVRKGFLALIASDGHRLSYISREMDVNPSEKEIRVVVPRKAMSELSKLCAEMDDEEVSFGREENHLFFQVGGCMLDCRVLEGSFPNFDKVIPKDNDKVLELGTEEFGDGEQAVLHILAAAKSILRIGEETRWTMFNLGMQGTANRTVERFDIRQPRSPNQKRVAVGPRVLIIEIPIRMIKPRVRLDLVECDFMQPALNLTDCKAGNLC